MLFSVSNSLRELFKFLRIILMLALIDPYWYKAWLSIHSRQL